MELRSNRNPRAYARGLVLGASLAALLAASPALAGGVLPSGGQVAAGQATIGAGSNGLVIDQASGHAIINWQNFSIGAGNAVKFNNGSGATLNRVVGGNLSQIDGVLKATGSVYLINPQGVVVGPGGKVITGGSFVASTRDIDNDAFMKGGPLHASGTSNGTVVNQGKIVSRYGDTILIGKSVSNSGIIKATRGTAGLAAGDDVTLRPMDGDARISISAGKGDVTNTGTIAAAQAELNAAGGNVYAVAGNQGGITVTGTKEVGGRIWLTGGDTAQISGTVSATNTDGSGGTIIATAPAVTVNADARISASGTTGGTVLLGGDEAGGSDPSRKRVSAPVATAKTMTVAQGAQISANGATGAGGAVVVWSDDYTSYNGFIGARGAGEGDGGAAEISSHGVLDFLGAVDLTARNGNTGTLLLDPYAVTIVSGTGGTISSNKFTPTAASNLGATTLTNALANASVTVNTGTTGTGAGSITLNSGVSLTWTTASTLTLDASAKSTAPITLGGAITATNGGLNIKAGSGAAVTDTAAINVKNFTLTSGNWSQSAASLPSFSAANFVIAGGTFLRVTGGDGSGTPYQIADIYGLQGMNGFQSSNFSLANDIDASSTATWNAGAGFVPLILNSGLTFDGQNHTISGLTISQTSWSLGLFNYNYGTIQNLTLSGGTVTDGGGSGAGALVGANSGTINNVHSSVTVSGADGSDNANYLQQAGGLVGSNSGTISNSSASGNVSGFNQLGGLVGNNYGQITNSSASGKVTPGAVGFSAADAGGLVGRNEAGTIDGGVASGDVVGQLTPGYGTVGGLVGTNTGTIKNSHASGNVTASVTAGGLVGSNGGYSNGSAATGSIDNSYYELGTVTGYDDTGGLVGANGDYTGAGYGGTITNSHVASTATLVGTRDVGGLVGSNYGLGSITGSYSAATVNVDVGGSGDQINEVGGLVGRSGGVLTGSYATGAVNAGNESYSVGGLAGSISSTASNVYATGAVAGGTNVGGLVGVVYGTVTDAHATGAVTVYTGTGGGFAGSLYDSTASVTDSYATGNVTAADATLTVYGYSAGGFGGFVGLNSGTISNAYAAGAVTGGDGSDGVNYGSSMGGFAASNGGTLSLVHATGAVKGFQSVGGLVGSSGDGSISDSYATGAVSGGDSYVGGLIGDLSSGTVTRVYATGAVTDTGSYAGPGNPYYTGGLIGRMSGGALSRSYATGSVSAANMSAVGGLIGGMVTSGSPGSPAVSDTYATGTVNGGFYVGGLVGEAEAGSIATSYAANTVNALYAPGGLVGVTALFGSGTSISTSYYDTTQGLPGLGSDGGPSTSVTGLTAAQMHDSSNFAGFDFINTWAPADATHRPELYGVSYVVKAKASGGSVQYGDAISGAITFQGLQNGDLPSAITGLSIVGASQGDTVGTYAISAAGATLTSSSGNAYRFVYENGSINITQRQLSLALIGSVTKTYDRTTDAALTAANYGALGNIYNGDDVSLQSYLTSGAFSDWNVGNNKTVTVSGLSLTGAKASNYTLGAGATGNIGFINPLQLTLGLTGTVEKTYNRSTAATVAAGNYTALGGVISGDTVTLDRTGASATYGDFNAGASKSVSVTGLALGGANAGNYSIAAIVSGNVGLIDPKTLTTTMKTTPAISKTYDGTDTAAVTASNFNSLSGIVSGDSGSVALSLALASAHYSDANVNTGKTVTVSGLGLSGTAAGNYVLGSSTLSANAGTITKKALTTLTGTVEKTYDKTTTATLTDANYGVLIGVIGNDDVSLVSKPTSGTYNSATGGSGKTVTVSGLSLTGAQAGNYSITNSAAIGIIDPAQLVYTAGTASKTYGGATPGVSGTITGLVSGDTLTGITSGTATWTIAAAGNSTSSNAGSYAITGGGLTVKAASTANYTLVQATGNATAFTINPATLTYTANAANRTYGDTDPAFSGTITGFVLGQTQVTATTGTLGFTTTATATSGVGSYAINGGGLAANNGNYVFAQAAANATRLTIGAATLTYTANSASRPYGAANPSLSGTVSGLKNTDTLTSVTTGTLAFTTLANGATSVGSYAITGGGLSLSTGNYVFAQAAGNATALTINPASLTVTANSNQSKVYGDTDPAFGYTISTGNLVNGDTLTGALSRDAGEDVGGYAITQGSLAASANYTLNYATGTNFNITPMALTVAANSGQTKVYGDIDPVFGYSFTTGHLVGNDTLTGALSRDVGEDVGNYAITQGGLAASANYTLNYTAGTNFNIMPMALTVAANSGQTKVYGDVDPAFGYSFTTGHLVGTDVLTGALSRDTGEDVGGYAIIQGSLAASANYTLNYATGTNFNITPMALTVAANSGQTKVYGDIDPVFGYSFTTGHLVGSDTLTGALSRDTGEDVGGYAIIQGSLAASANYTLNYATGTNFNITPMALTVAANSGQTKVYGDIDPVFGYQLTTGHLVGSDALSGALSRDAGEDVGNYAITQGSLAASANYTLNYATGTNFNITPMALTVAANSGQTKIYGDTDPTFGYSFTTGHLVGTDTLTGFLVRDTGEDVGNYAINQGSLAASANYAVTYAGANFNITPMALTVSADSKSKVYGALDPAGSYAVSGGHLVGGDTLTGTLSRDAGETVGVYAITRGTLDGGNNYTLAFIPGTLSITPAALTITAGPGNKVYGDTANLTGFAVSGLVRGDQVNAVALASNGAAATANAGSYAITASGAAGSGLGNYVISYNPGLLTVTPRALTVTIANASAVYGAATPGFTASASGLVNGDTLSGAPVAIGTHVGTYAITPGTLAASTNYVVSFQNGTFTITPAGLTVTANNIAAQDVSMAQPTASYAGLVNGDSSAVVSGLQFGLFPVTGTRYDVVPFGASAADYTIVYVAGVLTVSASQPSQPALPSQIALAIPPQSGSASGSLTIGGQTFVFANAATSAIPGSSDGGAPGVTLFQVGLPGHLSGFTNLVVSDYSNATGDSDRLATE